MFQESTIPEGVRGRGGGQCQGRAGRDRTGQSGMGRAAGARQGEAGQGVALPLILIMLLRILLLITLATQSYHINQNARLHDTK